MEKQGTKQEAPTTTSVRLNAEERQLLDEVVRREERSQSQVIRRSIRFYAKEAST